MSTLILNDTTPIQELSKVPVSAFLPSVADCVAICEKFVVLASRVIVDNFPHFAPLRNCVPDHIPHEYSALIKEKTISVSCSQACIKFINYD